jgi:RNA polymerase sigma-70 factor (ECF subfamily)
VSAAGWSEPDLVARARSGDRAAFDPLYRAHSGRVLSYALRLTHGDRWAAEDIAAEAWAAALDRVVDYDLDRPPSGFAAWVVGIAYYRAQRMFWVQKHERPSDEGDDLDRMADQAPPDPYDMDAEREREELLGRLYEAVATLPPRQRQVARLHLAGERQRDIAARLGLSEATVCSHYHDARRNLRLLLIEGRGVRARPGGRGNDKLTALMREANLSKAELSRRMHVAPCVPRQWVSGVGPREDTARGLADLLGQRLGRVVTMSDLGLAYPDRPTWDEIVHADGRTASAAV